MGGVGKLARALSAQSHICIVAATTTLRNGRDVRGINANWSSSFLDFVELRAHVTPPGFTIGGFPRAGSSDDAPSAVWSLGLMPEKDFSKTILTGEQTFDDWELGGEMILGSAE
jgi:hypothetical protein